MITTHYLAVDRIQGLAVHRLSQTCEGAAFDLTATERNEVTLPGRAEMLQKHKHI